MGNREANRNALKPIFYNDLHEECRVTQRDKLAQLGASTASPSP